MTKSGQNCELVGINPSKEPLLTQEPLHTFLIKTWWSWLSPLICQQWPNCELIGIDSSKEHLLQQVQLHTFKSSANVYHTCESRWEGGRDPKEPSRNRNLSISALGAPNVRGESDTWALPPPPTINYNQTWLHMATQHRVAKPEVSITMQGNTIISKLWKSEHLAAWCIEFCIVVKLYLNFRLWDLNPR